MASYSYNGKCYTTALAAGQSFCADKYPLLTFPTQNLTPTAVSCSGATAFGTDGAVLSLRSVGQGVVATTTVGTTSQFITFSQCSAANLYLGTPNYGDNVIPAAGTGGTTVITGTVTAVGTVSATGSVTTAGTVSLAPQPLTTEQTQAYLLVFAAALAFLTLIFSLTKVRDLFKTYREET